jgi:CRP-like cAMP-binding protein
LEENQLGKNPKSFHLKDKPRMHRLEEDRLARLSAVTRERRFSIGDTIVKEGDDTLMGHYLMMVRKGTVECTIQSDDGEQVMIQLYFSIT